MASTNFTVHTRWRYARNLSRKDCGSSRVFLWLAGMPDFPEASGKKKHDLWSRSDPFAIRGACEAFLWDSQGKVQVGGVWPKSGIHHEWSLGGSVGMGDQDPIRSAQVIKLTKNMDCEFDFHSLRNPRE